MKIAYNACYGGFGLSPLAITEYAKAHGATLTWYQRGYGDNKKYTRVNDDFDTAGVLYNALTRNCGAELNEIPKEFYYYRSFDDDNDRCDPILIDIIERLGNEANGRFAKLAIAEIPDGVAFEITEYDGLEDVVPPRMKWQY